MWRGVTRWKSVPFGRDDGASRLARGRQDGDLSDHQRARRRRHADDQLVAEIQSPRNVMQDWNLEGKLADFFPTYADWHFPWLDVAGMISAAQVLLEYPMVDRDPLPYWTAGRVTLTGDAAHPMYPRGGNGANQAILDVRALSRHLAATPDVTAALKAYEAERLNAANGVVLANRSLSPDKFCKSCTSAAATSRSGTSTICSAARSLPRSPTLQAHRRLRQGDAGAKS